MCRGRVLLCHPAVDICMLVLINICMLVLINAINDLEACELNA